MCVIVEANHLIMLATCQGGTMLQSIEAKNYSIMCLVLPIPHNPNLVGVNSIEASSPEVAQYFDLLQSLYTFNTASTHRWGQVFSEL